MSSAQRDHPFTLLALGGLFAAPEPKASARRLTAHCVNVYLPGLGLCGACLDEHEGDDAEAMMEEYLAGDYIDLAGMVASGDTDRLLTVFLPDDDGPAGRVVFKSLREFKPFLDAAYVLLHSPNCDQQAAALLSRLGGVTLRNITAFGDPAIAAWVCDRQQGLNRTLWKILSAQSPALKAAGERLDLAGDHDQDELTAAIKWVRVCWALSGGVEKRA